MDSKVFEKFDLACFDVNLYNGNMGGMAHNRIEHTQVFTILRRGRGVGMVIGEAALQAALHIRWQVEFVAVGLHANLSEAQRTISALCPDTPFSNLPIIEAGRHRVRSGVVALYLDLRRCALDRSAQPRPHRA